MKSLKIYTTHITLHPYTLGESEDLENMCSTIYDKVTHKKYPIGMEYSEEDQTLTIPRGISVAMLTQMFECLPFYESAWTGARMHYAYKMKKKPKNKDQVDAIKFLLGMNERINTTRYTQVALNVKPAFGKTYCSIVAALERGEKTLIICHSTKIAEQWVETIHNMTTVRNNRVKRIEGRESIESILKDKGNEFDIYIVLHQTLQSYEANAGTDALRDFLESLECGTKIVDECHLMFANMVHIDMICNIRKNYYLTATFTRSNPLEQKLFQTVFSNTPVYTCENAELQDVHYHFVHYNSYPTEHDQMRIMTKYGLSAMRLADYSFKRDEALTIIGGLLTVMNVATRYAGKILIVVPRIDLCDMLADFLKKKYPERIVGTIHSKHTKQENDTTKKECDLIISTVGGLGTGSDISMLRGLIIMEAHSSKVVIEQLVGRVGRERDGAISNVWELIDDGFQVLFENTKKKKRILKKLVKQISDVNLNDLLPE